MLISIPLWFSDRSHIDSELLISVKTNQFVDFGLVIGSDGAGAKIKSLTSQIKILAHVTRIQENRFIRSQIVSPFRSIRDNGPNERDCAMADKLLT
jgi:hypothetical protein